MSNDPLAHRIDPEEFVPSDDAIIGKAFRWSLVVFLSIGASFAVVLWALHREEPLAAPQTFAFTAPPSFAASAEAPKMPFTDITRPAGIDFVHENGAIGDKLLPETMAGGCAFIDYDDDGDPDLLFVNSTHWPEHPAQDAKPPTMALYRNDGTGRFENVTERAGLDVSLYGMGVAVGDYDADGWIDVYLTAVGANRMLRNVNGRFEDVTSQTGTAGAPEQWSTSAGFFDYDGDGDLDLFVCNYIQWSRGIDFEVDYRLTGVGRAYGPPMNFKGAQPYLFRNDGGTFTEVAADAGLHVINEGTGVPVGKSLGVMPFDVNQDGRLDLLVANDTVRNFLYINQGNGKFTEEGMLWGAAFDRNGLSTGAMGIDGGFYRNDDTMGFFIGNFANEMTSVYVSQPGMALFTDEAIGEGIGAPSRAALTFAVLLLDVDLDGAPDMLQANGHIEDEINITQPSQHYRQAAQLFWNCGPKARGCFVAVGTDHLGDLTRPIVGRGASYADIDADGDLDIVITQVADTPLLLRNDQHAGHHWLRVGLKGTGANRDAIGATIELEADGRTQWRQIIPTRGYLSQVELPATFGLGDATQADRLTITWPDGTRTELTDISADRAIVIEKENGIVRR